MGVGVGGTDVGNGVAVGGATVGTTVGTGVAAGKAAAAGNGVLGGNGVGIRVGVGIAGMLAAIGLAGIGVAGCAGESDRFTQAATAIASPIKSATQRCLTAIITFRSSPTDTRAARLAASSRPIL